MPDSLISAPSSEFLDKLTAIVGEKGIVSDPQARAFHETDWRGFVLGRAAAVVKPGSVEEVSAVVALCDQHGVKIVPQGGLTGLMGAGVPVRDGDEIVLSLARMNRIIEVNPTAYTMTVEAGVVLQTIQETAATHDRYFPISLGAQGSCMIGGNLSTNAGGATVLHYGNTRSMVLGLEVVLPDGRVWDGLRSLKKDNTGYDLKDLFVGAEGTLGVITKAVLKIFPKPKDVATAWLAVPDPKAALELLSGARIAADDNVTSCELMHQLGLDGIYKHIPGTQPPLQDRHTWQILMEWSSTRPIPPDGASGMQPRMEAYLADCMEKGLVQDAVIAQNEAQAGAFWKIREAHAEAGRHDDPACSFDISVAVEKIPSFIEACNAACEKAVPGLRPRPMGHMGDGNLHYTFSAPAGIKDRAGFAPMVKVLDRIVHDMVSEADGSISAEHGIGSVKLLELEHYRSQTELDVMRAIKKALDPKGIMNPGKVIRVDPDEPVRDGSTIR
ncbi:MAG: FAD-binding oxidoreductase [Alphaproteobacteria bacterium]|nr:FAD-binding oxidoreductase [Alphaproteobacteria bacterium]